MRVGADVSNGLEGQHCKGPATASLSRGSGRLRSVGNTTRSDRHTSAGRRQHGPPCMAVPTQPAPHGGVSASALSLLQVSSGRMRVLSPWGHLPSELALIIGVTGTQTGLPLSSGSPQGLPWFPRRQGTAVLLLGYRYYEAPVLISPGHSCRFLDLLNCSGRAAILPGS